MVFDVESRRPHPSSWVVSQEGQRNSFGAASVSVFASAKQL